MRFFNIPGNPVCLAGPHHDSGNDQHTCARQSRIRTAYLLQHAGKPAAAGPLTLTIQAWYPVPRSHTREQRLEIRRQVHRPAGEPALDSLSRLILLSLQGLAYHNTSQVVHLHLIKRYASQLVSSGNVLVSLGEH